MTHLEKQHYRDRIAALLALVTIKRQDETYRPKPEARACFCAECHAWI